MTRLGYLGLCLATPFALSACGWTPSNGVRPGPRGRAAVLLNVTGTHGTAVACYDPLWVELRGPQDCLDLVPPGVALGAATVIDRGPGPCAPRLVLSAPADGLWRWTPAGATPQAVGPVDLDADGRPEQVVQTPAGPRLEAAGRRWGACPPEAAPAAGEAPGPATGGTPAPPG